MNARPLISIVIPTKDRAALLRQALDSIRAQTYDNWEALVIDDHSKDESAVQTREAAAQDARIRYLPMTEKTGAPAARNLGISESHGDFVIFLDSDDLLAPHCLAQRIEVMQKRADLDFAIFPCQLFRKSPGDTALLWNCKTEEDDLDRFLKMDVAWQTTSPIWRHGSFNKILKQNWWDEDVLSGQDWEFHIKAIVSRLNYEWIDAFQIVFGAWQTQNEIRSGNSPLEQSTCAPVAS